MHRQLTIPCMGYDINIFDYFEDPPAGAGRPRLGGCGRRCARSSDFDLKLVPRVAGLAARTPRRSRRSSGSSRAVGGRCARARRRGRVRLDDDWIEMTGAALEAGGGAEATLADLADGQALRRPVLGRQHDQGPAHRPSAQPRDRQRDRRGARPRPAAQVERRSLISDVGRSMGEAMAGVMKSGRHAQAWPDGDEKSDHFVGCCYAEYVAAGGSLDGGAGEQPEDSLARELTLHNDEADELLQAGAERRPRGAGAVVQDARLGDRRPAQDAGPARDRLRPGVLRVGLPARGRRADRRRAARRHAASAARTAWSSTRPGARSFEEIPLVRADGLPTQHMRALAYWMAAPELDGHDLAAGLRTPSGSPTSPAGAS